MRRILALCAVALLAALGLVGCAKATHAEPAPTTLASTSASASASVPQRVSATLARIDAGTWPPNDGSGTRGGTKFSNFEGRLPARDASGKRVQYTEWDVNIKKPGRSRDAERIVTGSDGSAWYTLDHYESFTRIR